MAIPTSGKKASTESNFAQFLPAFEVGPFAEFNARNMATMVQTSTAMMKGTAAYWGHVSAFVTMRLQSDVEAARALAACRNGEDAARAQHEFVSKMITDYFNEMHELLSIGADVAKGVADPIEGRAEEALHGIEARTAVAAE